jgi:hypothetical protein
MVPAASADPTDDAAVASDGGVDAINLDVA